MSGCIPLRPLRLFTAWDICECVSVHCLRKLLCVIQRCSDTPACCCSQQMGCVSEKHAVSIFRGEQGSNSEDGGSFTSDGRQHSPLPHDTNTNTTAARQQHQHHCRTTPTPTPLPHDTNTNTTAARHQHQHHCRTTSTPTPLPHDTNTNTIICSRTMPSSISLELGRADTLLISKLLPTDKRHATC